MCSTASGLQARTVPVACTGRAGQCGGIRCEWKGGGHTGQAGRLIEVRR